MRVGIRDNADPDVSAGSTRSARELNQGPNHRGDDIPPLHVFVAIIDCLCHPPHEDMMKSDRGLYERTGGQSSLLRGCTLFLAGTFMHG